MGDLDIENYSEYELKNIDHTGIIKQLECYFELLGTDRIQSPRLTVFCNCKRKYSKKEENLLDGCLIISYKEKSFAPNL